MKVLELCLSLINITASLKILDNISVIIRTKKYDADNPLSFSSSASLWSTKRFR